MNSLTPFQTMENVMMNNMESLQKFGKAQIEAATAASAAMTKGMQNIATETAEFSKKYFEMSSTALQELLGVKGADKAVEVQTTFAKQAHESLVAHATKVGEIYTGLAKDVAKPFEVAIASNTSEVSTPPISPVKAAVKS